MVIGLLLLTAIPTTTGVAFATSEQRKANQRREDARRMAKFHIDVECDGDTDDDRDVHGRRLVVRNDKVCITLLCFLSLFRFLSQHPKILYQC